MRRFLTHVLLPGIICAVVAGLLYGLQIMTGISISSREVDLDSPASFKWVTLAWYMGIGLFVGALPEIGFGRRKSKQEAGD
ncbi:MAG: hypothetical protein ACTIC1_12605 [Brevibacterium sp.]